MEQQMIVGDRVVFTDKVYAPPFAPHYDEYKGHVFEVVAFHYEHTHVELKCIDADVRVKGYVHLDELRLADDCYLCWGTKGGIRGNENRVSGGLVCDYCIPALKKT